MPTCQLAALLVTTAFSLASTALAQTPSLTLLGVPANQLDSFGTSISADGRTAVGYGQGGGAGTTAFSWTNSGGLVSYGGAPGWPTVSRATAVSGDGNSIVGYGGATSTGSFHAFRYSNGVNQDLSRPGFDQSAAFGTNRDGTVVVGAWNQNGDTSRAMIWTPSNGMQDAGRARPGDLGGWFTGVSRDGTTAIGRSGGSGPSDFDAYTWTQAGGWRLLPAFPGTPGAYDATPQGVNFDGTLVVGYVNPVPGAFIATLWRNQQPVDLGTFGGRWDMAASGVSDDGSVIVGAGQNIDTTRGVASIWLRQGSPLVLQDYLSSLGVATPAGWRLAAATSVSADGMTISGYAQQIGANRFQAFVATIPAPGFVAVAFSSMTLVASRRRRTA